MLSFAFLSVLVLFFLYITILEQRYIDTIEIEESPKSISRISPLYLFLFVVLVFTATLIFLLTADDTVVQWYIRGVFSFLLIMHARLLTLHLRWQATMFAIGIAVFLAFMRFTTDSELFHNLFIIASLVWVGPFLVKLGILNLKRFVIISIIWMIYDIGFVWMSPGADVISSIGDEIGFQLALVSSGSMIGSGDLLWANIFISVIIGVSWKHASSAALVIVGLLYGFVGLLLGFNNFFPLLILWVPLGLGILYYQAFSFKPVSFQKIRSVLNKSP